MISQELQLDASSAEQTIQQIDQQLQQAAELFKVALADALTILQQPLVVPVTADTAQATEEIAALAAAPPVDVPVTADVAEAEQMILALGDQPPVDVPVGADTSPAQDSLTALAASAPPIDMLVEADTAGAEQSLTDLGAAADHATEGTNNLEGSVTALGAAAGIAEGSAKELVTTLGEMGGEAGGAAATGVLALGAATAGFFVEGLSAVSAGQRFAMVLGDMGNKAKEIDVNGLNTSIEKLGIQFGSTGAEMENATSKLFQFAVNAGASKDKAVEFAHQVETLAARAISLNPQLGTLADVTETLGPKLARGGRFAAEFGLALTPAEITARALTDTGKQLSSQLSVQEKAMAGAEIASERYGKTLAGTVAEGSKNAAVQAESLKASFKEAIEQIGVPLVSPVLDLIKASIPDAVLIAQDLGHLAGDVLPIVSAALTAVSVPLRIIDAVLGEIPGPVVTATAAFFAMSFAIEAVGAAIGVAELAFPPLAIATAAIVAGIGAFNAVFGSSAPFVDDLTKAVDTAAKGFSDFGKSVDDVIKAEVDAAVNTGDFAKRLNDAGVTAADLAGAVAKGGDAWAGYEARILQAAVANGASLDTMVRLSNELDHLRDSTQKAALKTLEQAVATHQITDAERTEAEQKAGLIDGHRNWAAALDIVQPRIKAAADATDAQAKAEKDAADHATELKAAMDGLAGSAPAVAAALTAVHGSAVPTADSLLALGTAVSNANLSAAQIEVVAKSLGVTTDEIKNFAKDATKALDDFVTTGLKGLPDLSAAIDDVLNPKKKADKAIIIDPAKLQAEIDADLAKIQGFNMALVQLHERGLDNLARVAAQRGPEFTTALNKALDKGGDELAHTLNSKFGDLNAATQAEGPLLRAAGAPIIAATGEIASIASADFHGKLDLVAPTQEQINLVNNLVTLAGVPLAEAWRQVGGDSAVAYETAVGAIPASTGSAMAGAQGAIDAASNPLGEKAQNAGGSVSGGFGTGIAPVPDDLQATFHKAAAGLDVVLPTLRDSAGVWGAQVGFAFNAGLINALEDSGDIQAAKNAATNLIRSAVEAAKAAGNIHSPSIVMMEVGQNMVDGLAIGLSNYGKVVDASALGIKAIEDSWRAGNSGWYISTSHTGYSEADYARDAARLAGIRSEFAEAAQHAWVVPGTPGAYERGSRHVMIGGVNVVVNAADFAGMHPASFGREIGTAAARVILAEVQRA